MNDRLKKVLLPFLIAAALYFIISAIFFWPLFQGKILFQSDVQNFYGMSKEAVDYRDSTGIEPLWTNSMFGGMPTYQISMSSTGNIFEKINIWFWLKIPRPANYMFLACIMFFILLKSFRINNWLAIGGSLAYGFSTFFITVIVAGHNPQANAMCYIPLVFAGINYIFRKKVWLGSAVLLLATALEFAVNHIQVTYYMYIAIACWMVSELVIAIRNKTLPVYFRNIGLIIAITVAAVATNTTRLWTTYEYGQESIRGGAVIAKDSTAKNEGLEKDYVFAWSYGLPETFTLMYPNFAGGGPQSFLPTKQDETPKDNHTLQYFQQLYSQKQVPQQKLQQMQQYAGKYWGSLPFTSGPVYIGAVICFLFLIASFLAKGTTKWWMIAATVISAFIAWGKYFPAFNDILFNYFPLYDKFRTVMMALLIACFVVPLLAFIVFDKFFTDANAFTEKQKINAIKWSGIIVVIFTIVLLLPTSFFSLKSSTEMSILQQTHNDPAWSGLFDALKQDRIPMIQKDAGRTFLFIALTAAALFIFIKRKIDYRLIIAVIVVLSVIDLWTIDAQYAPKDNYRDKDYYETTFAQNKPKINDKDPDFRVLNTTQRLDQDGFTPYFYKSIGGYHGAKLQRFQDIIDGYLTKGSENVYDMLNAKYVISQVQGKYAIQQNPNALGNAWFVDSVDVVKTPEEEFNGLGKINPKSTVVVHSEFSGQIKNTVLPHDSTASVHLTKYGLNDIHYSYTSNHDGPIVFSEIWYRGNQDWKAYIDGKYTDHFRADYLLRGIWAPAGTHTIDFVFDPHSYDSGKKISTAASGILILLILAGFFMEARMSMKKKDVVVTENKAEKK